MINNYWNNTEFADKLRGTPKLQWGTMEEWDAWRAEASKKHPVRYWMVEKVMFKTQLFLYSPLRLFKNVKYYIKNFKHPRHILYTDGLLERGNWYDTDVRLELCILETFCQFMKDEMFWIINNGKGNEVPTRECFIEYASHYKGITTTEGLYTSFYDIYVWWQNHREDWWEVRDTEEFDKNLKFIIEHRGVLWT